MDHVITLGYGPADRGSWPAARCICGWYSISNDFELVQEDIAAHAREFYAGGAGI